MFQGIPRQHVRSIVLKEILNIGPCNILHGAFAKMITTTQQAWVRELVVFLEEYLGITSLNSLLIQRTLLLIRSLG